MPLMFCQPSARPETSPVKAGPALDPVGYLIFVVCGRFQHVQISPVRIRHVRHADALAGSSRHRVARTAQHAVEDGDGFRG